MIQTESQPARWRRWSIGRVVGPRRAPSTRGWLRWGAVAASIALLLLAGLPAARRLAGGRHVVASLGAASPAAASVAPAPSAVAVSIDAERPLRPISPLIYGVATAGTEELARMGARLNRWGGNTGSRYNWELGNAKNAARDWEFRNSNYGNRSPADRQPSGWADKLIAGSLAAGAEPVITVPALGWVARDDSDRTRSVGVPSGGGVPLGALNGPIQGYDPAFNQRATSVPSFARKGAPFADPPDLTDERVYQDEWVAHLVNRFGSAAAGGVRHYVVDNEPDLWSETHTDVHPAQPGYDDLLAVFLEYAQASKDVDPDARVLGPALSGWTGYFYSPRDRGTDRYRTAADRRAHGGMPFLPWWLDQVRQHDERVGRRTLDALTVHFYPQARGVYSGSGGGTDDATNALRLRSTRALWDPTYVDESWIREPVYLIPRLRAWVEQHYPGTGLAIGEWNWGADKTVNGALAIADVLGIYGREGVDLAAYWRLPAPGSPGALAFALYRNYDGRGSGFGDLALPAGSDAPDDVATYASLDSASGDLLVVAINKRPDAALETTFRLDGFIPAGTARLYRYGQDDPGAIRDLGELPVAGQDVSLTLPPWSITLLRVAR